MAMAVLGFGAGPALGQVSALTINIGNSHFNPVLAGGLADYRVRIDNSGNFSSPATPISFTIPAGAVYEGTTGFGTCSPASVDVPAPTVAPIDITCEVPSIGPGGQILGEVHIVHMVAGTAALRATIPGGATFSRTSTVLQGADLEVVLDSSPDPVLAGNTLNFSAMVTNNGPYGSSGGQVVLTLPTGLSTNVALPGACSIAGRTITCDLPALAEGASAPFDFSAQVITGSDSTISLSGTVDGASPRDPNDGNDTDTISVAVTPGTDVGLAKTRAPSGLLLVDDPVTFTLTPILAGVTPVSAEIVDNVPANYTIGTISEPAGWTCGVLAQAVTCAFDRDAPGAVFNAPITIAAIASSATTAGGVTNEATISAAGENDGADGNNFANDGVAHIREPVVDLRAYKSGPPRNLAAEGVSYPFRLRAANDGLLSNIPFSGELRIVDHVPLGLTITDATLPGGWSCLPRPTPATPVTGPADIICTTNNYLAPAALAVGASTPELVLFGAANGDAVANQQGIVGFSNGMTVEFDGWEALDGNPGDNTTNTGWIGTADNLNWADIEVEKTVVTPIPPQGIYSGDEVTFRIEIINNGPGTAEDVRLTDHLVGIVHENGGLPQTIPFTTSTPDLVCTVPAGSGYSRNLLCQMDTLAPCGPGLDCPYVEVTVRPGSEGNHPNTATVYSYSTPDNNDANNESTASVLVRPRTDVTVTKASPFEVTGAAIGQEITYVITARVPDNGLSGADAVTITDTLPDHVRFISATASTGTCTTSPVVGALVSASAGNNVLSCELGRIENGDQETVIVVVVPTMDLIAEDDIVNTVEVSTSTDEVDGTNNSDAVTVSINPPELDLVLSKVDTIDPVQINTDTTYRISLRNMGPSDATDVVITDILPVSGLDNPNLRLSAPGWTCSYGNVSASNPLGELECAIDYFPAGSEAVFEVDMTAIERGRHTNTARATSRETLAGYETITDNNEVIEDTTVRVVSDVAVTKNAFSAVDLTDPVAVVDLREEFAWVITVTAESGPGLDIAEGVTLVDMLPEGMLLTRAPLTDQGQCQGAVQSRAVSCDLGDIAAGDTVTVTLYVRIVELGAPGQAISNTATADTLSFDFNEDNDSATGTVMTVRAGAIAGGIWWDFNNDGVQDAEDVGVNGGVVVNLAGRAQHDNEPITRQVNLGTDGTYLFEGLPPGTYSVSYTVASQPRVEAGRAIPGPATAATANGQTLIEDIVVVQDQSSIDHDFTLVPQAILSIDKSAGTPVFNADGSYTIAYRLDVTNGSREPLTDITIIDDLTSATGLFGTYTSAAAPLPGEYTVSTGPQVTGNLTGAVSSYTGQNGNDEVVSGGTLGAGTTIRITYSLRVNPDVPRVQPLTHGNTADIAGTGQWSGQTAPSNPDLADSDTATATPVFAPAITLAKTAQVDRTDGIVPGTRIEYTFQITNTGNTPLQDVSLSDPLDDLVWVDGSAIPLLAPDAWVERTAYYEIKQADIDRGSVLNEAEVEGQWGISGGAPLTVSDTDDATVTALSSPALALDKTIASHTVTDPTVVGQTITYQFVVTNTGNTTLSDVVVDDPLLGTQPIAIIDTLAPGAVSPPIEVPYEVTLADIDRGNVPNTATASGEYGPAGNTGTATSAPDSEDLPLFRNPAVDVVKVVDAASLPAIPRDGDTISWTVTATNTGNVTLTNLVLSDPLPGAQIVTLSGDPAGPIEPGDSVSFTVTAPLTQAYINAGEVENQATLDFDTPAGPGTPEPSGNTPGGPDEPTITPLNQVPEIGLIKTMITPLNSLPDPIVAQTTLEYQFTIRNLGNLPLHQLILDEDLEPFTLDPASATLLANAVLDAQNTGGTLTGHEIVLTGTYTLTQADVDAGQVTNQALVTGYPTHGPTATPVTDQSGTAIDNDTPTVTSFTRDPQIRLVKSVASVSGGTLPQAGDVVTYSFDISNVGNVTLDDIVLTELMIGADVHVLNNWTGPLLPGQTESSAVTATYVLTQADIDRGLLENSAQVSGTGMGPNGPEQATDISGSDIANDDPTQLPLANSAAVTIVKSEVSALSTPPVSGDVITYSFLVTNTGNLTLTNVVVTDPLPGLDMPTTTIATLLPGDSEAVTLTATYVVQQADIEFGRVDNQADVTADYIDPATQQPGSTGAPSNPITVPLAQVPSIALIKTASSALNDPTAIGEEIEYTFTVRNTGNLDLTDVVIDDPLAGITPNQFVIGTLAPGAEVTVGPAIYAIVQADIDRGEVVNQATATGISGQNGPNPVSVDDLSGPTFDTDEPIVIEVFQARPGLEIEKSANFVGGNSYALVGDRIDFTFTITNTGNVAIDDVQPRELDFTFGGVPATGELSDFTPGPVVLQPGQNEVFTASYLLTQDDLNSGAGVADGVNNTAEAVGSFDSDPVVSSTDTATLTLLPQPPSDVTITKTTSRPQIRRGETVPFVITVTNNSLADAGLVTIIDTIPPGFAFVEGSASVNGANVVPRVQGRDVIFEALPLRPKGEIEIGLVLRALPATSPGRYVNVATGKDSLDNPLAPPARADVEILAEAVFDCSDVIGTVFNDLNGNGYQDQGEPGIAGVRISTARGTLVTTDAFGRYSIPCAALPDGNIGSNFILKIDDRTLPTGFSLTTDNPAMVRLTAGKMVEVNFGVSLGREISLTLSDAAFVAGSTAMTPEMGQGLSQLIGMLEAEKSRLVMTLETKQGPLAGPRLTEMVEAIRRAWRDVGAPYALTIETTVLER